MSSSNVTHQLFRNSDSIIQRLPVEVLVIIFSYIGPPSAEKPYIYFTLSWVCRQWRSIILDIPNFWTVIRYNPKAWGKHPDFVQEIFRRSKSCPLDISTCQLGCSHLDECPGRYVISESSRIKSLFVWNSSLFDPNRSKLICPESFPQLENLIFHNLSFNTVHPILLASRPRFIQISGGTLLTKEMSRNLSHVEWFKFHCKSNLSLLPFFHILQHLPNLKILNIYITILTFYESHGEAPASMPVVTLPNLRMLSLDLWDDQFQSINTPSTLDYVGLSRFSKNVTHDWRFLDCIDLSTTKSFRVKIYDLNSCKKCNVPRSLIARITMGNSDDNDDHDDINNDCQVFENFHRQITPETLSSVDSHLILPPKNTFCIELHWLGDIDAALSNHLKKAVNLVQLTLDYQSFKSNSDNIVVTSQLLSTLDTVTHLKVLRCRNFSIVCGLLGKKLNVPRLERLSYHSSCKPRGGTAFVLRRLRMMKNARVKFGYEPLKVLEMRNFLVLSPQQIEEIEEMGIRFIQMSELT